MTFVNRSEKTTLFSLAKDISNYTISPDIASNTYVWWPNI